MRFHIAIDLSCRGTGAGLEAKHALRSETIHMLEGQCILIKSK